MSAVQTAEWTSVPTLMHHLHARLAETLMSTGDYNRIFTVDQTITTYLEHILTDI